VVAIARDLDELREVEMKSVVVMSKYVFQETRRNGGQRMSGASHVGAGFSVSATYLNLTIAYPTITLALDPVHHSEPASS
jgi:hypothetical protein